jgi:agmatinase
MSLQTFDPNSAADTDSLFGLPFTPEQSKLVLLTAPFEATTSYLGGTSRAPDRVAKASLQVDLFHPLFGNAWEKGIAQAGEKTHRKIKALNTKAKALAKKARKAKGKAALALQNQVNKLSQQMTASLQREVSLWHQKNKVVGVLGGDHSIPFAAIEQAHKAFPQMGILHLDAHLDLRKAYEGFEQSHASIFYNVMTKIRPQRLVQVGIRDFCEEEVNFAKRYPEIRIFYDHELVDRKAHGHTWDRLCDEIINSLPNDVYLSFDIDGLDPQFCPATGTPVPGGPSYSEILYLLQKLVKSRRRIVGFDLCEVGPEEWDANVGARMLFSMACATLSSWN